MVCSEDGGKMLAWLGSAKPQYDRFILLDRDGVINVNRPDYVKSLAELHFYEDALEAFRFLEKNRVGVMIVSNQSGINRGLIARDDFLQMHEEVIARVEQCGGRIQGAFYCPHRPDEKCRCRKPSPDMLFAACRFAGTGPGRTFFVGDSPSDMEAAANAGCPGVRLLRVASKETLSLPISEPLFPTLLQAVLSIYGK